MNKEEFIKGLSQKLNYPEEKCVMVNEILESNFVISKKSKEPIMEELTSRLGIDREEALKIYETAVELIKSGVKDSLMHPFKNKD